MKINKIRDQYGPEDEYSDTDDEFFDDLEEDDEDETEELYFDY